MISAVQTPLNPIKDTPQPLKRALVEKLNLCNSTWRVFKGPGATEVERVMAGICGILTGLFGNAAC